MNYEYAEAINNVNEGVKNFEELEYTRDFGAVNLEDLEKILKENSEYWRIPTAQELFYLFKHNKKSFFKYVDYWAEDPQSTDGRNTYKHIKRSKGDPLWFFNDESPNIKKYLVLIKKGTELSKTEDNLQIL